MLTHIVTSKSPPQKTVPQTMSNDSLFSSSMFPSVVIFSLVLHTDAQSDCGTCILLNDVVCLLR